MADVDCHESNLGAILGPVGAVFGVAALIVALRVYVRFCMSKHAGGDDAAMLGALMMALGTLVCFLGEAQHGSGRHFACLKPSESEMLRKWQYFHSIWVMVGVVLVKISVALFLERMVASKLWKRCLWGAIIFLSCFCLACAGTLVFSCLPVEANWKLELRKPIGHARCFTIETYSEIGLFNSVVGIATDFVFALVPIPVVMKLQMNRRTRFVVIFILSLSLTACAAGIVKAKIQAGFLTLEDPTWANSFNVWNMIELCLGIIAASLPTLRGLFLQLLDTTKTALGISRGSSNNNKFHNRSPGITGHRSRRGRSNPDAESAADDIALANILSHDTANLADDPTGIDTSSNRTRPYHARAFADSMRTGGSRSWASTPTTGFRRSEDRLTPDSGIIRTTGVTRTIEERLLFDTEEENQLQKQ